MARENAKKKRDWVLYAYILQARGGQLALHDLIEELNAWPKRDTRRQRVGQILGRNKRRGFIQVEAFHHEGRYVSIWAFQGELPEIPKRTLRDWEEKLDIDRS